MFVPYLLSKLLQKAGEKHCRRDNHRQSTGGSCYPTAAAAVVSSTHLTSQASLSFPRCVAELRQFWLKTVQNRPKPSKAYSLIKLIFRA
jgi:hypothetical protein